VRRLVSLAVLLFFAIPFGLSVSGCKKALTVVYCNGGDSGPQVGQVATITLSPTLATYGESLSYGQIGQSLSASAQDCKGTSVSVRSYIYATSNMAIADINPTTGQVCSGLWNRFSGGGIADYTTCNPPTTTPPGTLAYVTASGEGAVSNAIPVYIHPVVTSIALGSPAVCSTNPNSPTVDPSTNCCSYTQTAPGNPAPYDQTSCVSQTQTRQLAARVYANGGTTPADNITCEVGHLSYAPQGSSNIATIDENGVITANQPGSVTITASIAQSGSASAAGFFSTCPPKSIVLTANGSTGPVSQNLNNELPFTATVLDTAGNSITGLSLEYNSTNQQTIPTSSNTITPVFPGTADITAACNPATCNPSPFSQIGYLGNGVPLTSNGITVNTSGTSSTVLYIGSTSSQYLYPQDFTTNQPAALLKLPYVPNSMVINEAGTTIYLGSPQALMTVSATTNAFTSANTTIVGPVLTVSPDSSTLVTTDPNKKTISIISSSGSVEYTYGGVANRAQFSPDSQTVYITGVDPSGNPQLLVHNIFTGWTPVQPSVVYNDIAVTVPHAGAYFAGTSLYDGRSYCPTTTLASTGTPPAATNLFYPLADEKPTAVDRISATTNGEHILGASAASATLQDIAITLPITTECPQPGGTPIGPTYFTSTPIAHPLTGVTATAITGVLPSTNSEAAFVTYTGTAPTTGGQLPFYIPAAGGNGTLSFVTLSGAAAAPVSGVFSSDNLTFYTGTTGDNLVHLVTVTYPTSGTPTAAENTSLGPLTPALPGINGGIATPNLLVQRPKKSPN
jgi:hypothetical protein